VGGLVCLSVGENFLACFFNEKEITIPKLNVEWNGFDSWRLFLFITSNKVKSSFKDEPERQALIDSGVKDGSFIKKVELYFKAP